MLHLIQLYKLAGDKELFIKLFDDLSFEIDEMGYKGMEGELINDMLLNHLGLEMEDDSQLQMLTDCILRHQGKLESAVRGASLYIGKDIA